MINAMNRLAQATFALLLLTHLILYSLMRDLTSLAVFGNAAQGIALVLAALQFTRAAVQTREKNEIRPRALIAVGLWIFVFAHAMVAYSELLLKSPSAGTVADVLWLIGYIVITRSMVMKTNENLDKKSRIRRQAGLLTIIAAIVAVASIKPLTGNDSLPVKLLNIAFPFFDLWISGMAFLVARQTRESRWMLLAFGSFVTGIADLILAYFPAMSSPIYRTMDIPLFIGYSMWWLLGTSFAASTSPPTVEPAHRPE